MKTATNKETGLLQSLAIDQGAGPGGHPFTVTRTYEDQRNLVKGISATWGSDPAVPITGYEYIYDERGQRSKSVQSGSAFYDYGGTGSELGKTAHQFLYNGRGELTADIGYLGSDITDATQQLPGRRYEYGYDPAGNRQWSNRTGNTTLRDDYTTNALNQYTTRENNTLPLSGTAEPDAGGPGGVSVAVQGGTLAPLAAGRKGRYWSDDVTVNNNANPAAPNPWRGALTIFTAKTGAGLSGSDLVRLETRMAQIAADPQTMTYDLDGNLTHDGIWSYTWDAENRLVQLTTVAAPSTGYAQITLKFRYDYPGRRVEKLVTDSASNQLLTGRRYLYDGWNLIAEYSLNSSTLALTLLRSYTWGLDIARSLSDAGGVGALLQIADHTSGKTFYPCYDGNGNVVALVNSATGAVGAAFEYSPYGEILRADAPDPAAGDQPFRFSTKFTDVETGLVYYGRRYYHPWKGRFLGRDPKEEMGGRNLYAFVTNNPINRWDYLGMYDGFLACGYAQGVADWNSASMVNSMNPSAVVFAQMKNDAATAASTTTASGSRGVFTDPNGTAVSGNGQLGAYLVQQQPDGTWKVTPTDTVTTGYGFVNGITGNLESHADLGVKHLQDLFGEGVTSFTLFNIPTTGFWGDVATAGLEKLGFNTDAVRSLAGVLGNVQDYNGATGQPSVQWVAHSGGGAAFAQALNFLSGSYGDLSMNTVTFDAGANNALVTNAIARNVNVTVNGYNYSPLDAVPNIVGFNGNPISIAISIIAAPTLFIGPPLSDHTRHTGRWQHHSGTGGPGG